MDPRAKLYSCARAIDHFHRRIPDYRITPVTSPGSIWQARHLPISFTI